MKGARLRHHMVLPPMSSAAGSIAKKRAPGRPSIDAVVEQPARLCGSQDWRNWTVEPGEVDPARSRYIDELLAKRREACRG